MQCFDQVVAFYLANYAGKSSERQKQREKVQPDPTAQTPLQFQLEPMEIDQSGSSSNAAGASSTTTTTTTTATTTASPASRAFEEELAAVETTLQWYTYYLPNFLFFY